MRLRLFLIGVVNALIFLVFSLPALADGVILTRPGGGEVLDGETLEVLSEFSLEGSAQPLVAVHPQAPVAATYTPTQGVVFWNLPGMSKASSYQGALVKNGIVDIGFSQGGESLFLLSTELRAVVVLDLAKSEVAGLLPVPGAIPVSFQVAKEGLLVSQESGFSFLSTKPGVGLLAQYRYPEVVAGGLAQNGRLYVSLRGQSGVWVHDLLEGQTLGLLPAGGEVASLSGRGREKGLVLLGAGGAMEGRDFQSSTPLWAFRVPSGSSSDVELLAGKEAFYVLDRAAGVLVALNAQGKEVARASVSPDQGPIAAFEGVAR